MAAIHFDQTDDLVDICHDNVFKAVFTNNTPASQGALSKLLSAIIGRNLSVITITKAAAGELFTSQDIRGKEQSYEDLQEAYQIALLVKGRFFKDSALLHRFEYYDREQDLSLGGRSRIITLELSKAERVVEKPIGELSGAEQWGLHCTI
jgi:hypothetical protein